MGRDELLAAYVGVLEVLEEVGRMELALRDASPAPQLESLELTYVAAQARLVDMYLDALGVTTVSRCPFTDARLEIAIDSDGLDGLWWDHQGPVRPWWERPPTLVSFTGAMRLATMAEDFPWLACPGPGVPYVLPRLLVDPGVRAVVSTVPIGTHTGYVIAYFAAAYPTGIRSADDWGASDHAVQGPDGRWGWDTTYDHPSSFDFDLVPWIAAGRVLWIRPGDETWAIRSGVEQCPYLSLPGVRFWQRIQDGLVW